jgi:hypothetical protein
MPLFILAVGLSIFSLLNYIGAFDRWQERRAREWFGREAFRPGTLEIREIAFFEYMRRSGYDDFSLCMDVIEDMKKSGIF